MDDDKKKAEDLKKIKDLTIQLDIKQDDRLSFYEFFIEKNLTHTDSGDFISVFDFLKSPTIQDLNKENPILNIEKYFTFPFERLVKKAEKYNKKYSDLLLNSNKFNNKEKMKGETIVYQLLNGYSIVKIDEKVEMETLKRESSIMQHCIGQSDSYLKKIKNKDIIIYSLRDKKNSPHATLQVNIEDNTLWQLSGKQNRKPTQAYLNMLIDFIASNNFILTDYIRTFFSYSIGNKHFFNINEYKHYLINCYKNKDFSDFNPNTHFIIPNDFDFIDYIPNIKIYKLETESNFITYLEEGFSAEEIILNNTKNIKNINNISVKKLYLNNSGIQFINNCHNLDRLEANNSELINLGEDFSAEYIHLNDTKNIKNIKNITSNQLYLNNSLIENILNCKIHLLEANNSTLINLEGDFYINNILLNNTKNIKKININYSQNIEINHSSIEEIKTKHIIKKLSIENCKNIKFIPEKVEILKASESNAYQIINKKHKFNELHLNKCNIKIFKDINTDIISLSGNKNIKLNSKLKYKEVYLNDCDLMAIPNIKTKMLDISNNPLSKLEINRHFKVLNISTCFNIKHIPKNKVELLICNDNRITSIEPYKNINQSLLLINNIGLKEIPALNIRVLNINGSDVESYSPNFKVKLLSQKQCKSLFEFPNCYTEQVNSTGTEIKKIPTNFYTKSLDISDQSGAFILHLLDIIKKNKNNRKKTLTYKINYFLSCFKT